MATKQRRKTKHKLTAAAARRAQIAASISPSQLRFSTQQSQVVLAIGNTKFWEEVAAGRIEVRYDGKSGYCTPETLKHYAEVSGENAVRQVNKPRAVPGMKGVQVPRKPQPAA